MKKSAFTMIELVFVIVILGILAAVAIPKLSATRSDAEASVLANALATCVNGATDAYMMDTSFDLDSPACDTATADCFSVVPNDTTGILTVTDTADTTPVCVETQGLVAGRLSSATGKEHHF